VTRIVAWFQTPDAVERAVQEATAAGLRTATICSPVFNERLLRIAGANRTPVPAAALAGALAGGAAGLIFTIYTVRQWPDLIVGGKPLIALPSFLIVAVELLILLGAIAAAATFQIASMRARRKIGFRTVPMSDAHFVVVVDAQANAVDAAAGLLMRAGADGWKRL